MKVAGVAGDVQIDLELIPKLYELKRQCGGDIAYGRRASRPDGLRRALATEPATSLPLEAAADVKWRVS